LYPVFFGVIHQRCAITAWFLLFVQHCSRQFSMEDHFGSSTIHCSRQFSMADHFGSSTILCSRQIIILHAFTKMGRTVYLVCS
jgi:hypothetical protein